MQALQSPAVNELTTEAGTYRLLDEWLGRWFDGRVRSLGGEPAALWPAASRRFGQGPITAQPLQSGVEIRVVLHPRAEGAAVVDTALYQGKLITDFVTLNFWVRSKAPGTGQSQLAAQQVADLLKALLTHPDSRVLLAQKGICQLRPQGPATLMPSADYAMRLLSCSAQLQYPVSFGGELPTEDNPGTVAGAVHEVDFRESYPVLTGDYLLGTYRWTAPVRLSGARAVAWASQDEPVVLGLEVNGVLTGDQLTLPVGPPNTEVTASVALDRTLDPNAIVRWRVVSAPDAPETAWHVTLALSVSASKVAASIPLRDGVTGRLVELRVNDGELDVVDTGTGDEADFTI